ncbi:MAG TPA: hypothetical protein VNL13_08980 [Sulfolobales archaeon]|nr:hypothetical protein [Sulfolobales archaeon]
MKRIARNARSIGIKGLKQWNPHTISEDPKDIKRIFERNEQIRDYEGASSLKEDAEPNPERSS